MAGRVISLGHGSGGRLTRDLVRDVFIKRFDNRMLAPLGDSAVLEPVVGKLALTTDGFVVSPLVFAGGDIGKLAVNGTVNDLAVAGAVPLYLCASFILEEGLDLDLLESIADSMAEAARLANVLVVTGDTKVVERGHGDGVFVTTAGVGRMRDECPAGAGAIRAGDAVLVSGPIGDHGAVIAAHRSGLELAGLESDCAPVSAIVDAVYMAGVRPRIMRDPTRGGAATVLSELAEELRRSVAIDEQAVPVREGVRTVCEILGLDPLYLACEGRLIAIVPCEEADRALAAMRGAPGGQQAARIGEVIAPSGGPVVLRTRYGGTRIYDTLATEQLPRIC
jgi:hydrogenase expression/formation protein HypE